MVRRSDLHICSSQKLLGRFLPSFPVKRPQHCSQQARAGPSIALGGPGQSHAPLGGDFGGKQRRSRAFRVTGDEGHAGGNPVSGAAEKGTAPVAALLAH